MLGLDAVSEIGKVIRAVIHHAFLLPSCVSPRQFLFLRLTQGAERVSCLLPPLGAGLSHVEILESYPRLARRGRRPYMPKPWNRIGKRPESKRELLLRTFDAALCSQQRTAYRLFPHAIALPL